MRFLQIFFSMLVVLSLCSVAVGQDGKKELRIAYLKSHTKDGQINPVLDHYYRNMLGSEMGVDVVWVGPLPFTRILASLKDGTVDMFYAMSKSAERQEYIDFPDFPCWFDKAVFVVPKESPIKTIEQISDLYGRRVGYCSEMVTPAFAEDKKVMMENLYGDDWGALNLKKLKMGRLDLAFFPSEQMCGSFKDKIDFDFDLLFREITPAKQVIGDTLSDHYDGFSKTSSKYFLDKYKEAVKKVGIFQDYYLEKQ